MSLNNISFPLQLVADLYQKSLVQNISDTVPFLGNYEKKILLVVNKNDVPYLPDGELAFLTTVLSACALSLSDVAIVNRRNTAGNDLNAIFQQLQPKQIVLFDVAPEEFDLPPGTKPYQITTANERQFVSAPALAKIEKNKEAKKQLWLALKQLFGL